MRMIIIIYVNAYLRRQPKIRPKNHLLPTSVDVIFKPTIKTEYDIIVLIVTALLLYYYYYYHHHLLYAGYLYLYS
jgi:hypothetical protein